MLSLSIYKQSWRCQYRIMNQDKKSGYHHGSLKESLILHAFNLLDEAGPDAVTIRAVARRAQVSHAAPANHFHDRTALLTEQATRLFQMLDDDVRRKLSEAESADRARAYMEALLEFGLRHPNRYLLMWRQDLVDWDDDALSACMDALYDSFVNELANLPRQSGRDPHTLAISLWSMIHGYVTLRLNGVFKDRSDEVSGANRAAAMLDLMLAQ